MLGKSLKDKLVEVKKLREIQYVNFFNDGRVTTDERNFGRFAKWTDRFDGIYDTLESAVRSYSYDPIEFDRVDMDLAVGLVYEKEFVNGDNTLKPGAEPLKNIVRYYTESVRSFKDLEQTNTHDYYKYGVNRQGYIKYSDLVNGAKNGGLDFYGPETFEELKQRILANEQFNIMLSADLRLDDEMKLSRK